MHAFAFPTTILMLALNASLHVNKVSWAPNPIKQDWKSSDRNWPDRWLLRFPIFHLTAVPLAVCCNTVCSQGLGWRHSKAPPPPTPHICLIVTTHVYHLLLSGSTVVYLDSFMVTPAAPQAIRLPLTATYHLLNYPWQRVSTKLHIFEVKYHLANQVSRVLMEDCTST